MARKGTAKQIANYMLNSYWNTSGASPDFSGITRDGVVRIDLSGLTADGKQLAKWAMASWESVAGVDFREVRRGAEVTLDDAGSAPIATYRIAQDGSGLVSGADLTIPKSYIDRYGTAMDQYAYQTFLHELGHVMGLGHTGPYDSGSAGYSQAIFTNDSWQMSVMSYFDQAENPTVKQSKAAAIAPMAADILAAQAVFGAPDTDATRGDTVWGRNSTLDTPLGDFFREMTRKSPDMVSDSAFTFFLKDSGGRDTIDFSFDDRPQEADLGRFVAIRNPGAGTEHLYAMIDAGTRIENYRSGGGTDTVTGTGAANDLRLGANHDMGRGKGGDDRIDGDLGDDRLYGNGGQDRIWGGEGQDRILGGSGADTLWGEDGSDTILGGGKSDMISGGTGGDVLSGQAGADTILGGDGLDRLDGGSGADRLDGGTMSDRLTGGAGGDTFVFTAGTGTDIVTDYQIGLDRIEIDRAMLGTQTLAELLATPLELDGELMLRFGTGDRLVLEGISERQLDQVDFLLV